MRPKANITATRQPPPDFGPTVTLDITLLLDVVSELDGHHTKALPTIVHHPVANDGARALRKATELELGRGWNIVEKAPSAPLFPVRTVSLAGGPISVPRLMHRRNGLRLTS